MILREINLGECRSAKSVILAYLEALNCDLYLVLFEINHIKSPKIAKRAVLVLQIFSKVISRKIHLMEKS